MRVHALVLSLLVAGWAGRGDTATALQTQLLRRRGTWFAPTPSAASMS